MHAADGALRHGVLYDLVARGQEDTDLRAVSVQRMASRFDVDTLQAQRVAQLACTLFSQLQARSAHAIAEVARLQRKVNWAGYLHEIGCQISHSYYHKHGA